MSLWGKVTEFFTGGSKTAEKVVDMADKAFYTEQERGEGDQADLKDSRESQVMISGRNNMIDIIVDAINRLIRPWITLELCAMMFGYRDIPILDKVDDFWKQLFLIVITFWFSGRLILKDLPSIIKALRK